MYFVLFFSMNLLNFGFTQKKNVDSVAEDQHKWSEIQTKNKKYDTQQNLCFFHSGKQNSRGWSITGKRVFVLPNVSQISILSG